MLFIYLFFLTVIDIQSRMRPMSECVNQFLQYLYIYSEVSISHHDIGNRWGNSGNRVRLYFLGSKITADGDCNHEIKNRLFLERKVMTNLDSILKSRDITLPTKVHLITLWFFQWSCMVVRVGLWRKLSTEELMLLNCGAGEDSWESLGLKGDPTSPS